MTQEEAESLRSRVTALEKERADLKYVADRLETKVVYTQSFTVKSTTSPTLTQQLKSLDSRYQLAPLSGRPGTGCWPAMNPSPFEMEMF